jgi:hypothetical protein
MSIEPETSEYSADYASRYEKPYPDKPRAAAQLFIIKCIVANPSITVKFIPASYLIYTRFNSGKILENGGGRLTSPRTGKLQ